jgi:hypothetical protein
MKRNHLVLIAIVAIVLVVAVSVAQVTLRQTPSPKIATLSFFSNNAQGYACFLANVTNAFGGPYCMSDDPSLFLPGNATVPVGNYTIIFFPFGTASNRSLWLGTNNVQVTGTGAYDPSSSYANVTISGDGAIAVFILPDNTTPVPEFSMITVPTFAALASLFMLRWRR